MMTPVSYALALWLGNEDSFAPLIFTATLPLLLLSGVLLPMSFAPDWLRVIAAANPLAYAVDASRAIFNNHLSDPSIGVAVAIMAVLAAIAVSPRLRPRRGVDGLLSFPSGRGWSFWGRSRLRPPPRGGGARGGGGGGGAVA